MDAVVAVRSVRLKSAEVVPDLVTDDIGAAEAAALAVDQGELAAEVVQVGLAASGVDQRCPLAARAGRRGPVEPDEEVLTQRGQRGGVRVV